MDNSFNIRTSDRQNPFRLVATDLDGTLLRRDKTVSSFTSAIVQQLFHSGIHFVLISARPPRTLRRFAQQGNLQGLAICSNGAIVYDLLHDKVTSITPFTRQQIFEIIPLLREKIPGLLCAGETGERVVCEAGFLKQQSAYDTAPPLIVEPEQLLEGDYVKLLLHQPEHSADELAAIISPLLPTGLAEISYSAPTFVELAPAGIDKGKALALLCSTLGIRTEEVIAFGDMPNDIPMLTWAGMGVAVANAHPDVLAIAEMIAPSHMDDGVAQTLAGIFSLTESQPLL